MDFNGVIPSTFDKNRSGRMTFHQRQEFKRRTQPETEMECLYSSDTNTTLYRPATNHLLGYA